MYNILTTYTMAKTRTSFALSRKTLDDLKELAEDDSRSQASMLEVMVARAKMEKTNRELSAKIRSGEIKIKDCL